MKTLNLAFVASAAVALALSGCRTIPSVPDSFVVARPVWPEGLSQTPNTFVRFTASFDWQGGVVPRLRLTAASAYRANLNGELAGYGPARATAGWCRVDEWPLDSVKKGRNVLEIDVAGYYLKTFQYELTPSFLQAEVLLGDQVLLATPTSFAAQRILRLVVDEKYSNQRGFPSERYVVDPSATPEVFRLAEVAPQKLLAREVPYPEFKVREGAFRPCAAKGIGPVFAAAEMDAGFVGVKAKVTKPGRVVLEFEEALVDGRLDPFRNGHSSNSWHAVMNRVVWDVKKPGSYVLETFEPYVLKYAAVAIEGGEAEFSAPYVRQYRNPLPERARYRGNDPQLAKIFAAAQNSLAPCSVDVFMDCASRERSGWMCDSWFSSQTMAALTGDRSVERAHLMNVARPWADDAEPSNTVMNCGFPRSVEVTMPTYMMWFVIQCAEYADHAGSDAEAFRRFVRNRILSNLLYLESFRNADGLLEDLPGWVFIEWSDANRFTKGVGYPANMLYAVALDAAYRLYGDKRHADAAAAVRAKVREQSFDGRWFCDHALRDKQGRLVRVAADRSEVCQYYAFFADVASPKTHSDLWNRTVELFAPGRPTPEGLRTANMFFGHMLRLRLLKRFGREDLLPSEIKALVGHQAEESGSLWEFTDGHDSRCHSFASYVATFLL